MGDMSNFTSMLKDGYKHLSGLEESVLKNIEACKQLSHMTRTSLGPNGMNKMVINHLDKLFVTSDAATMLTELEVQHPAAKLVVMASKAMQAELGDGTNLVTTLAGELLSQAEELVREGLHPSDIVEGYEKATKVVLEALPTLVLKDVKVDVRDPVSTAAAMKASIASKQLTYETLLSDLVAKACIEVCPKNPHNFNVDNVRVCKIVGGSVHMSAVVHGIVIKRDTETSIKQVDDCKVVVYGQAVDTAATETKGTVLIENAEQMMSYSRSEEDKMEEYIKGIYDAGARVVVSNGSFGELALHFIERYGLMALKIPSKFELRRFCRASGAVALVKNEPPKADEMGYVKSISVEEIGGTVVTVLKQDENLGKVCTLLLRAATDNVLDDLERAIDDGVNSYKALTKEARLLPAAGAVELELSHQLYAFGRKQTGLDQYAINKFATALEVVPRVLCENAGLNAETVLPVLRAAHANGQQNAGLNLSEGTAEDLSASQYYDLYEVKYWAIRLATDAVMTVLRVDQIIMAKQAGGPKAKNPADEEA
jgi:T-complex protein 1 subunit theta